MSQPCVPRRRGVALLVTGLLWFTLSSAQAEADKPAAAVAATLLRTWQFGKAGVKIRELVKHDPNAPMSHYLQAELDFFEGKYQQTVAGLQGLEDNDINGNVGPLRALAASSYAVTKGFVRYDSPGGHFAVYYAPGKDQVIAQLTASVLEAARSAIGGDLGHLPAATIRVEILGKPSDLAMVSTLTETDIETTGTIALCKYGKLMIVSPRATLFGYPWMDTLTHELVHYIVSQVSRNKVPVWLHEGLARYLQVRWRGPATGQLSSLDESLLSKAIKKNTLISFDAMYPSMAKLPSQEAAALAFAEVSTMIGYLHQRIGKAGLQEMLLLIRDGTGAREAVAQLMKRTWRSVESNWKKSLKNAGFKSKRFAERGKRVRFRKGKGYADNVGVEAITNSRARKFTRLAGMLRAQGLLAASALEYEKARALSGSGDPLIGGKLSRVYLELGRFRDAISVAKPLVALDDADPVAPTTLGAAHLALGEYLEAGSAFELALRISPFDQQVRCGLAESYEQRAHKDAARERRACEYLRQVR